MTVPANSTSRTKQEIADWLVAWIAKELKMTAGDIDPARSLLEYSMSSLTATILVGDLEDWLDLRLQPSLVWDYPSIDAMTDHLAGLSMNTAPTAPSALAAAEDPEKLLEGIDQLSDEEVEALLSRYGASR